MDFRKYRFLSAFVAVLFLAEGQGHTQDVGFNTRTSAAVDWKVAKGLHVNGEYELRSRNSLDGVERHQVSLGVDYKLFKNLKVGADYIFIGHLNSSDVFKPRHRLSLNASAHYDVCDFRFSLSEKLQLTHKAYDVNRYQEVPNQLQLKSRLAVKYRALGDIEPYAYFELRNIFNAPRCSATWSETSASYTDYQFLGYDDVYVNRLRGAVGLEWSLSKRHSIDFTALYNWTHDLEIDTNKEGTKLKSLAWETERAVSLCVAYKFSF